MIKMYLLSLAWCIRYKTSYMYSDTTPAMNMTVLTPIATNDLILILAWVANPRLQCSTIKYKQLQHDDVGACALYLEVLG
jgi:hypothetical protein